MTDAAKYKGYDRAGLDDQYDNRKRHPEHVEISAVRAAESEAARQEFKGQLDVPFGPSKEETLDVFMPEKGAGPGTAAGAGKRGLPVNVFFHGGYWYSRHKNDFSFMARGVVPAGGISVIVNYALVPAVDLDELVRQCRASLAWTHDNIASLGGDPRRIFVSGHSAGGHVAAMMLATEWARFRPGLPGDLLKGGVAISGLYDLEPMRRCYLQDTLKLTPKQVARLSPEFLKPQTKGPLIVAVGGGETDEFIRQSRDFAKAWQKAGVKCELMELPGQNHFTVLAGAADPKATLGRAIVKQMGLA